MSARGGALPRIVVGVDGSPSSLAALRWAVRQAGFTGGAVDAVIAWQFPVASGGYAWAPAAMLADTDYQEIAEKVMAEAIAAAVDPGTDVHVTDSVREGNAAQVLIAAADGAELLVVGSRGHGGFAEALLGSVGQHCVHHAPCPVVVIRGQPD